MKYVAVLLAVLSAFNAFALDAYWKDGVATGKYWVDPQYWTDADGAPVAVPPTNRTDTAVVARTSSLSQGDYVIRFASAGGTEGVVGERCPLVELGKVSSPNWVVLTLGTANGSGPYPSQKVSVADPDDFHGMWNSADGRGEIELRATAGHSPKLDVVNTYGMMTVTVPEAGTAGSVASLVSHGSLVKGGAGDLTVVDGAGWDSRIYVRDGNLTLKGRPDGAEHLAPMAPVPGAFLHLDATRADTFTRFTDEEGRDCVAEWRDCDGGAVKALTNGFAGTFAHQIKNSHAPYFSGARSTSGLPLVDFGRLYNDVGTSGAASNCWLKLTRDCTGVREVFYVAKCAHSNASTGYLTLLGFASDSGTSCYELGGGGRLYPFSGISSDATKRGELYVNGFRSMAVGSPVKSRYGTDMGDLSVVSLGVDTGVKFDTLGSDRCYSNYTGGWQVGEVLVYTNALTHDERMLVNRYLMAKWHANYRDDDVGEVVLDTDTASITVPDGRVVRLRQLATMGTKIVKRGGGTVIVDGLSPAGVPVEIQGGAIKVVGTDESSARLPANPYFRFDASVASTLVHSNDESGVETKYVTRWNDCEGGPVYARVPVYPDDFAYKTVGDVVTQTNAYFVDSSFRGHLPWINEKASPTGLDTVNFGNGTTTFSFMQCNPHDGRKAYAGFIVAKRNVKGAGALDWFGAAGSADMLCHSSHYMLQDLYSEAATRMASWTFDGRTVDPNFTCDDIFYNEDYHVIAFSASTARQCDVIAKYTLYQLGAGGGLSVGEFVTYDRLLTPAERRAAEAYLMRKWLGRAHPESREAVSGSYGYADGEDKVIDTDASGLVTNLVGGTGAIVKRGAGAVRIDDPGHEGGFTSLTAEEGALTLRFGFRDDAAIRFDASDTASFTKTYETEEGGQTVTNLLWWRDSVGGKVAHSAHENGFSYKYAADSASSTTNPVLTTAEMRPGCLAAGGGFPRAAQCPHRRLRKGAGRE